MVQIIEQSLPYGKLAENFGRNLGESLGTETTRQLGVRKLPALADQLAKSGTTDTLEIVTKLLQLPGMTEERAAQLSPLLQSGIRSRAAERLGGDQGAAPQQPSSIQGDTGFAQARPQQSFSVGPGDTGMQPKQAPIQPDPDRISVMTQEQQDSLLEKPYYPDPIQIARGGADLRRQNPGLYPTIEASEKAYVDQVEASNQDLLGRQAVANKADELTKSIRTEAEERISNLLQSGDVSTKWNDLPGVVQNNLKNEAVKLYNSGRSKEQAADTVSKKALNIAKTIADMKDLANRPFFGRGDEKSLKRLAGYQKTFSDVDALDEYRSLLMSMDYGPHVASVLTYPMSVDLRKVLAKPPVKKSPGTGEFIGYDGNKSRQYVEKVADKIGPSNSIEGAALILSENGIDENILYDEMNRRIEDGEFTPNESQQSELQSRLPVSSSIGDIFEYSMPGKSAGPFGWLESVNRTFTRKR